MTHSTTNKLEVGSETLTDREYDLYWPKILHPDTHRLQIQWPGIHITAERPQKSGQGPQNSSQHHQWIGGGFQKHSHTVHGTSIYQKDFGLTPIDYKSTDLEYTSQQKDLKKAVKGHRTVHSTTNELEVASKALTDCAWDLHLPKRLQPDTHRLQIQWPGIHITAERPQKSGQGPWNGPQHHQ